MPWRTRSPELRQWNKSIDSTGIKCYDCSKQIEVAFFRSISFDAAGAGEKERKGNTPKERTVCRSNLGHTAKSRMTVTRLAGGALSERFLLEFFAGAQRRFFYFNLGNCAVRRMNKFMQ